MESIQLPEDIKTIIDDFAKPTFADNLRDIQKNTLKQCKYSDTVIQEIISNTSKILKNEIEEFRKQFPSVMQIKWKVNVSEKLTNEQQKLFINDLIINLKNELINVQITPSTNIKSVWELYGKYGYPIRYQHEKNDINNYICENSKYIYILFDWALENQPIIILNNDIESYTTYVINKINILLPIAASTYPKEHKTYWRIRIPNGWNSNYISSFLSILLMRLRLNLSGVYIEPANLSFGTEIRLFNLPGIYTLNNTVCFNCRYLPTLISFIWDL